METPTLPFFNFDEQEDFHEAIRLAKSHETLNFMLDFNSEEARCAFNVDSLDMKSLLGDGIFDVPPQAGKSTRWIHLWKPEEQKDTIDAIAEHYGFSPRLTLSMRADPMKPQPVSNSSMSSSRFREMLRTGSLKPLRVHTDEKAVSVEAESQRSDITPASLATGLDLNHYKIVNELWHFMSVDWGHRYTSIGYNALYNTRAKIEVDVYGSSRSRPEGTRIWWWIVLCDDGTVVSIQENPFPGYDSLDSNQQHQLESIRYNCLNVFKQISNVTVDEPEQNEIMTVAVRPGRPTKHTELQIAQEDSSSLLLYYLFDDWYSIYSLVAKSEHQYRLQLDQIRKEMFRSARLDHVHKLHSLGRQLSVLKRMYEGYDLIIERVINGPQQRLKAKSLNPITTDKVMTNSETRDALIQVLGEYGVPISVAAGLRFERLADRIKLYALSEIQSCLEEKDSLMSMNFNLIAIKEESYVERLTRVTVLLAKATILFIPISFIATYFTIPFPDITYSPTQFWSAFAVIFTASILVLMLFGIVSGTQEAGPIYRSLTRSGIEAWRRIRGRPTSQYSY